MISKKLAEQFHEVLKQDYGQDVTLVEAAEMLGKIVGYYDLLAKINFEKTQDDKTE